MEWTTWDNQRLEDEYSPSRWSKRCPSGSPAQWVVDNHVRIVTEVSAKVRECVPCELAVPYGSREGEKFDIYGADDLPKDAPVFVYIHGGYWQLLDRTVSAYCVTPLHQAGIVTVIMDYDLAPSVKFHEIVEEIQVGISAILKWAAERGSRSVVVGGHSAGAHLAAMPLYNENGWAVKEPNFSLIRALVLISGIYDLRPLVSTTINDPLKLNSELAEKFSPMHHLMKLDHYPRELKHIIQMVVVAEHDSSEFKRQSKDYTEALKSAGANASFDILDSLDHFSIVEKLQEEDYILTQKIIRLMTN